jgi:hypothetical protein
MTKRRPVIQAQSHVGPKSDSVVETREGIYCFGIFETAQAMFGIRVPANSPLPEKFLAAVEPDSISRHPSTCGKYEFVIAIRLGASAWFMPDETPERKKLVESNWRTINYGRLKDFAQ